MIQLKFENKKTVINYRAFLDSFMIVLLMPR